MVNNTESHILLFDGVCNLCNGFVKFTIKRDPSAKFKFASLQSESGQKLLKKFGLPTDDFDSFVLIIGDKYFLKSSAGLNVLKQLGGIWSLFYIFIIFPRPIRDCVYNMIAKTRYRILGKRASCMVPTPENKLRFLK
ncbi:MAG: thiol-disulfide oxidoreductase DCC family protein [Bacteroidetes bacterium]|nr:thiol-disulfide oxidoreductase DCC family protein [Bacteroidota bacterium]